MKEILVKIPENKYQFFMELLSSLAFVKTAEKEQDFEVPEWQKEIVRERIRTSKPEDMLDWEKVKDSIREE